ncbi:2,5-dichloro-2,5-cyclohexadiene-1,4-diol dehydrogenase [Pseudomonas sp. IT-194MI4]|jgi:NAD(P)-dependent dehydrogenase (short-subunit alcohol dehydrogenase family)|uniref:Short chain dehydrogenase n=3 Tax=Pseudomonas TaxID=286 RepID=I6YES8_PSEPU|nr:MULTISPECIES: SDR family oxidoreductase [Pseudomonas]AFN52432.1 short chain dehydrogenase [Pseudomonas putida]KAB0488382.1 SDR family oxidoreductase [Pseudomonas reinekei]KAB0509946.1 SDR family oxidoreductase [Pseudomonas moorei]OLU05870.1 oxidoreductase [Pseudomonas reinekei]SDP67735.1 NAD(P)-dependent dehydrogenase, short-chain alcohol dehydrogenase family [Pseudomonas reinekei]
MSDLNQRNIIVTGASGGIGKASVIAFAEAGARVIMLDRDTAGLNDIVEVVQSCGGAVHAIPCDITDEAAVKDAVDEVISRFGVLHGAFNNAGIEQSHLPLHEISAEAWDRIIKVDLTGVFYCMKHQIRAMLASGGGSIVNTASALGAVAIAAASDYIAAKHGVLGLTKAAAVDYGPQRIRVNAVLPGIIETPMILRLSQEDNFANQFQALRERHPIGRFGKPEEIAAAALWLLSDKSSFVTGTSLSVDGGYLAI